MAVPATLHIGRPYMLCTPGRARGPGGGGRPVAVPGVGRGEGGAGGGEGGGGKGHGSLSGRPPGACTPGSGHVKSDLHHAALPPRPHERAGREPRPRGGTGGAAGAAGATLGRATPHTTRHTPAGSRPAPRRWPHVGPGARRGDLSPRERHLTVPGGGWEGRLGGGGVQVGRFGVVRWFG